MTNTDINELKDSGSIPAQYGWICPKCGTVMAPWKSECAYCTNHSNLRLLYQPTSINPYYSPQYSYYQVITYTIL